MFWKQHACMPGVCSYMLFSAIIIDYIFLNLSTNCTWCTLRNVYLYLVIIPKKKINCLYSKSFLHLVCEVLFTLAVLDFFLAKATQQTTKRGCFLVELPAVANPRSA